MASRRSERIHVMVDAARRLFDRPVIEPAIVYANLLLPGQELAVHTDVPEFRGANRKVIPQWLLVVMHHKRPVRALAHADRHWHRLLRTRRAGRPREVSWLTTRTVRTPNRPVLEARQHRDRARHGLRLSWCGSCGSTRGRAVSPVEPGNVLAFDGDGHWSLRPSRGAISTLRSTSGGPALLGFVEGVLLRRRRRTCTCGAPTAMTSPSKRILGVLTR